MTSGEIMVSLDPAVLKAKLLNPPNEARRQETVDKLRIVHSAQDDPHYDNIVALVPFSNLYIYLPFTLHDYLIQLHPYFSNILSGNDSARTLQFEGKSEHSIQRADICTECLHGKGIMNNRRSRICAKLLALASYLSFKR